ncbi:LysE family translocator [Microbulbifer sp. GL-2]|uniref:LysE family translocator n=1 Tax=Microbulbifer sp. GL-2 TaxID=2591606 RepID=UPI0011651193|nr:LysE family translocator [Microbulbifer sp. GL-2]BBM04025.1 lysine transporter LysE [Microbulbifer sp. GL-2]
MNTDVWLAYFSVVIIAVVLPGPATMLAAVHSIKYGVPKSLTTISGAASGVILISTLSVLGVGSIAYFSGIAFTIIRVAGALYLIFLGVLLWKKGISLVENYGVDKDSNIFGMYRQGLLVSITSPKTLTVSTAIFPQFIDPAFDLSAQFVVMISTFAILTTLYLLVTVYLANRTIGSLGDNVSYIFGKVIGGTMASIGGVLVVSAGRGIIKE